MLALSVVVGCGGGNSQQPTHAAHPSASSEGESKIADVEAALGAADVKSFGGSDKLPIGGPLASIKVRQSDEEKHFIDGYICVDESECFGPQRFERYILARYPEIARVQFRLPPDLAHED
ncbi:MAG: hypothetical protein JWP44_4923, partial [Mucilaginibacter sp.]|nr:hypothetical protein [Mucilaginibacter sp.]